MIYVTGDTHGRFVRIYELIKRVRPTIADILIILGDAGINYFDNKKDLSLKAQLAELPLTFLCIHGNHEMRPENISSYQEIPWRSGTAYVEKEFPNLVFAKDGEVYQLEGMRVMPIGGAYSTDKDYLISGRGVDGWCGWWADEEPSDEIKKRVETRLEEEAWKLDVVLSHTCPKKYLKDLVGATRPASSTRLKLEVRNNPTEDWLETIETRLDYKKWYCGHWHVNFGVDKLLCLFEVILPFVTEPEAGLPGEWGNESLIQGFEERLR